MASVTALIRLINTYGRGVNKKRFRHIELLGVNVVAMTAFYVWTMWLGNHQLELDMSGQARISAPAGQAYAYIKDAWHADQSTVHNVIRSNGQTKLWSSTNGIRSVRCFWIV